MGAFSGRLYRIAFAAFVEQVLDGVIQPGGVGRAVGDPATSWRLSDAVRADGMIYASRRVPERWHIALFSWNKTQGAQLRRDGPAVPWGPKGPASAG